jgi:hypothetical protein
MYFSHILFSDSNHSALFQESHGRATPLGAEQISYYPQYTRLMKNDNSNQRNASNVRKEKGGKTMTSKVTSRDGTKIAYDKIGQGPVVIIVGGALSSRSEWSEP